MTENDKLEGIDLELLEAAFLKIDIAVDRYTKSPKLVQLWQDMYDLLEFNGIEK